MKAKKNFKKILSVLMCMVWTMIFMSLGVSGEATDNEYDLRVLTFEDEGNDGEGDDIFIPETDTTTISYKKLTCTLSVKCDTIIDNMQWLDKEKAEIVPEDGIIFAEKTVVFYEGESVFNLLFREMKKNKIHMEFENVPIYNSAYIEGIANIYEFDCGELSGWMYKVNGWFPNYGCSRYQLKAGDKVEWVYTCNLGIDVGGYFNAEEKGKELNGYFNERERNYQNE